MKITKRLQAKDADLISFSFEITPPLRGGDIGKIFTSIEKLIPYDPMWIDITSHAPDIDWVKAQAPSLYEKKVQKKRPGTISVCAAIEFKYGIECVPHLLCRGFSIEETEDSLIDLNYLGIDNVLAIRGDGNKGQNGSHAYATDLIEQISNFNKGQYLHQSADPSDFCIGIGFYPEKHFESPNLAFDIEILKKKEDLGAEYAISQMFFDNDKYMQFLEKVHTKVSMAMLPGIKILTKPAQLSMVPSRFFVDIPEIFSQKMLAAKSEKEQKACGVDWAYQQCVDLIEAGQTHLHFYILQNAAPLVKVLEKLKQQYPNRFYQKTL